MKKRTLSTAPTQRWKEIKGNYMLRVWASLKCLINFWVRKNQIVMEWELWPQARSFLVGDIAIELTCATHLILVSASCLSPHITYIDRLSPKLLLETLFCDSRISRLCRMKQWQTTGSRLRKERNISNLFPKWTIKSTQKLPWWAPGITVWRVKLAVSQNFIVPSSPEVEQSRASFSANFTQRIVSTRENISSMELRFYYHELPQFYELLICCGHS